MGHRAENFKRDYCDCMFTAQKSHREAEMAEAVRRDTLPQMEKTRLFEHGYLWLSDANGYHNVLIDGGPPMAKEVQPCGGIHL